jgi:two-component system sensor kinase FixL
MLAPLSDHATYDGYLASDPETRAPDGFGGGREIHGQRKDGTVFPVDLHVSAFDDGAGRRFVGTIRDITSRKQTEDKLRRQQAELAHVLRLATIERLAAGLAHELNQPLSAIANGVEACAAYVRSGKRAPRPAARAPQQRQRGSPCVLARSCITCETSYSAASRGSR